MGDLGQGTYNVSVSGTGGVRFTNTTALEYVHKSLSVFIQTDKAIYKPGQKVLLRAIVVDRKLRPSATTRIDVYVTVRERGI
jgi:CD109 antigen